MCKYLSLLQNTFIVLVDKVSLVLTSIPFIRYEKEDLFSIGCFPPGRTLLDMLRESNDGLKSRTDLV
jgi:hypothetical protein